MGHSFISAARLALSPLSPDLIVTSLLLSAAPPRPAAKGKLNLIDLAGSERVAKSGALDDKQRFSEATNINKSLSCLGDVIHALGAKQKHIPYRNSKLTHLLQDSLGGKAKTVMLVQVSPVVKNVGETVCSLNFAQRVQKVELGTLASKRVCHVRLSLHIQVCACCPALSIVPAACAFPLRPSRPATVARSPHTVHRTGSAKKVTESAQVAQLRKKIKELEAR